MASRFLFLLSLLTCLAFGQGAMAHSAEGAAGSGPGLPIAAITHGQMPVIARHAAEILALAERHADRTVAFQRVANYAKLQRAYCLWGAVPGSLSDEASPFNGCMHASLAALRDLLLRMTEDRANPHALALAHRIDAEMMQAETALELCSYSLSPFDTATLVRPDWRAVPRHLFSMASFVALAALLVAFVGGFMRWCWGPPARG